MVGQITGEKKNSTDFPGFLMVKTSSNAEGTGLTPDEGTKIPPALWQKKKKQNMKQKQYCNKFNKDFKNKNKLKKF